MRYLTNSGISTINDLIYLCVVHVNTLTAWKDRHFIINLKNSHQMKKSTFWIVCAAISIIFTIHAVCNINFIQAMIGCATCCASLVIGAYYERKEREQEENN